MASVRTPLSPTEIQNFLADLVRTEGPAQFIQLLRDRPRWLDTDALNSAERYVNEREGAQGIFTTRRPLALWKRFVHGARRVSSVGTFEQLAQVASEECVVLWDGFIEVLKSSDARIESKQFDKFLTVREEWNERERQINEIERLNQLLDIKYSEDGEVPDLSGIRTLDLAVYANTKTPLAVDEPSLLYLSAFATFYVEFDRRDLAITLVPILERLESVGFNVRQMRESSGDQPTTYRRTNSGEAALWFFQGVPVPKFLRIISRVRAEKLTFDTALIEAQTVAMNVFDHSMQHGTSGGGPVDIRPPTREFYILTCSAAFAVLAAAHIETLEQATLSVQTFKNLIGGSWWKKLSCHERASTFLRLCNFMMAQMENIADPHQELTWCETQIRSAIETTDFRIHPGLERDMRLAHARMIVELSKWSPQMVDEGIAEFKRGLNVSWGRFDCEARGLGICDLAGAMWRSVKSAHVTSVFDERAIEVLYKSALIYAQRKRYPFGRITVLTNYAIFLNEKQTGNTSHNQELALRLVDESIEIEQEWRERVEGEMVDGMEGLDSPATPHRQTVQASVCLTRGNIIRARTFGQMPAGASLLSQYGALPKGLDDVTASALSSYLEGLRSLGETGHNALRGLLHLNIGYAYLEARGKKPQYERAIKSFHEASRFLVDSPHDLAQAKVAEIETLFSLSASVPKDTMLAWHRDLLRHSAVFEAFGDLPRACRALIMCSRVLTRVGRTAQLAKAADTALRAKSLANRLGGGELRVDALKAEARSLVARMHRSRDASQKTVLAEKAMLVLTEALEEINSQLHRSLLLSANIALQEERSALAANMVWLQIHASLAVLDAKSNLLTLASASDVLASRSKIQEDHLTDAKRKLLRTEDLLWANGRAANVEQHVADDVERLEDALDDMQRSLELEALFRSPQEKPPIDCDPVEGEREDLDNVIVIQYVISEWGGLAVLHEPNGDLRAIPLPIDRAAVGQWLRGSTDGPGWLDLYDTLRTLGRVGEEWRNQCEVLQTQISKNLWAPLTEAGVVLEGRRVQVVPGQLAALPLHTAYLHERLLIDVVSGFGYLPTIGATRVRPPVKIQQGLLVLSDPVQPGQSELPATVEEIATISQVFLTHGVSTRVLAHSWGRTGREVFRDPHRLAEGADIGDAPTAENTLAALFDAELFVYAGHGHGVGSYGGALALTDGNGKRADLSLMKALSSSPLSKRPGIILSACETAWEMSGTMHGRTSIASTFLRLGASFVLGSLWLIYDARALVMSNEFVSAVLEGDLPDQAFIRGVRIMARSGAHVSRWGTYCLWFGQISGHQSVAEHARS